jgi:hypothetical protein
MPNWHVGANPRAFGQAVSHWNHMPIWHVIFFNLSLYSWVSAGRSRGDAEKAK